MADRGITTVILRPGYIDAGRGRHYVKRNLPDFKNHVNVISVKDVSDTILFLLSDSARGFNATELVMDGGLTAGKQR